MWGLGDTSEQQRYKLVVGLELTEVSVFVFATWLEKKKKKLLDLDFEVWTRMTCLC